MHSSTINQTTLLDSVTNQIMAIILDQLTIRRKKCMVQQARLRPIIIMSDKTILNYLSKKLIIKDDADAPKVYFLGEYMYQQELWPTDTLDKQHKIARYVIEQNTVR